MHLIRYKLMSVSLFLYNRLIGRFECYRDVYRVRKMGPSLLYLSDFARTYLLEKEESGFCDNPPPPIPFFKRNERSYHENWKSQWQYGLIKRIRANHIQVAPSTIPAPLPRPAHQNFQQVWPSPLWKSMYATVVFTHTRNGLTFIVHQDPEYAMDLVTH